MPERRGLADGGMSHGGELHRRMRRNLTDMTSTTSALLLHIAISSILLPPGHASSAGPSLYLSYALKATENPQDGFRTDRGSYRELRQLHQHNARTGYKLPQGKQWPIVCNTFKRLIEYCFLPHRQMSSTRIKPSMPTSKIRRVPRHR